MHVQSLIAGVACLFFALLDAFQTVILPRRAHRALSAYVHLLFHHLGTVGLVCRKSSHAAQTGKLFSVSMDRFLWCC